MARIGPTPRSPKPSTVAPEPWRIIRERFVTEGFEIALNGKPKSRVRGKVLDGEQEAKIIALRLGQPPKGFANWTLRLLAEQAVALEIVESVSHETLRRTLKKTA